MEEDAISTSKEDCNKVNKKLRATAKRILKQREKRETELTNLGKIDDILKAPDEDPLPQSERIEVEPDVQIPEYAPGLELVDLSRVDYLFSENKIQLKKFVPEDQTLFGHLVGTLSDQRCRNLLLARVFELRNSGLSAEVRLYVLHLMACTTNYSLMTACAEFLHKFPCALTTAQVIPLLLNFGISADALCFKGFKYEVPAYLISAKQGRDSLPVSNIQKVMEYLCFCIEEGLLVCDDPSDPLLVALPRLGLDRLIGGTPLVACISETISVLAMHSPGSSKVANRIFYGEMHLLNQLEIFRTLVRPLPTMQRAFLRLLFQRLTNKNLPIHDCLSVHHLRSVLQACIKNPLPLFVTLHLLICVVPALTIPEKHVLAISTELSVLENYAKTLNASDHMRIHSACAQLRGLVMMARTDA